MTVWRLIVVPFRERDLAAALGARRLRCADGSWETFCTSTQFKSKAFARWRDAARQRRVAVYPDASEAQAARDRGLRCDTAAFAWYAVSTAEDPATEMDPWMVARLQPAVLVRFSIPFELKEVAKRHRLQWCPADRRWTGRFHCGVPDELRRFAQDASRSGGRIGAKKTEEEPKP